MEEFNGEMLDSGLEVERMGVMLNIKKNRGNSRCKGPETEKGLGCFQGATRKPVLRSEMGIESER